MQRLRSLAKRVIFKKELRNQILFLKSNKEEDISQLLKEDTIFEKAINKYNYFTDNEDLLNEYDIECVIPNSLDQDTVQEVIYDGVKSNKDISLDKFYEITNRLKEEGCEKIILGCTELSALRKIKRLYQEEYLDAMEILADDTVNYVNKMKNNQETHK